MNESNPETWLEEHGDYLLRYAMVRLSDKAAAEDAVQETFLAAMKGKDRFDGRVPIRYWLLGILKHKVVDYIRKACRETHIEDMGDADYQETALYKYWGIPNKDPEPWQFNPRRAFEQKEFWDVFKECLSKLHGPRKQAFTLKELEGVSTPEICKELGVEPNNLWVILHRARGDLKKCLETNWKQKNTGEIEE